MSPEKFMLCSFCACIRSKWEILSKLSDLWKSISNTCSNSIKTRCTQMPIPKMLSQGVFMWNMKTHCWKVISKVIRRLEGQLSVLPNFTNSPKNFHIIKDFNLNVKTIFKSTSFQNWLQVRVLHLETWEKRIKHQL